MARNPTNGAATGRPSLKMTDFAAGNAKDAMKAISANTRPVYMVPIEHLQVAPGFNVRVTDSVEYRGGLEALKRSIIQEGFYSTKPLAGFVAKAKDGENVVYVTDGHRRLEAAKMAAAEGKDGLDKLPVILKPASASSVDLAVALHLENSGQELSMLEKAVLVKRMLNAGMSEAEVAERLDMTVRYIGDLMVLIAAPKAVRNLVSEGKIAGTLAVRQLRQAEKTGKDPTSKLQELSEKKTGRVKPADVANGHVDPNSKTQTLVMRYNLVKGTTVPYDEIDRFRPLFADSDWYSLTDVEGEVRAEEDVAIIVKIIRPRQPEPVVPKKRVGRPTKAQQLAAAAADEDDEGVGVEVDPITMQGDDGVDVDVADLASLGIADPADPAADL